VAPFPPGDERLHPADESEVRTRDAITVEGLATADVPFEALDKVALGGRAERVNRR
jgi:hypothetical protein